ncbi:hypothetical protein CVN76_13560 [Bacillus sp. mrc49]|nr:hypothetical protein CVN76_13560 [Bacillus sp. mrc49]
MDWRQTRHETSLSPVFSFLYFKHSRYVETHFAKGFCLVHATVRENGGGKPFPPVKFIREMNALMILCDTKPYPVKMERASW